MVPRQPHGYNQNWLAEDLLHASSITVDLVDKHHARIDLVAMREFLNLWQIHPSKKTLLFGLPRRTRSRMMMLRRKKIMKLQMTMNIMIMFRKMGWRRIMLQKEEMEDDEVEDDCALGEEDDAVDNGDYIVPSFIHIQGNFQLHMGMGQNPVPLVNIPKMMIIVFIGMFTYPILMVIAINPWPYMYIYWSLYDNDILVYLYIL